MREIRNFDFISEIGNIFGRFCEYNKAYLSEPVEVYKIYMSVASEKITQLDEVKFHKYVM